MVVEWNWKWLHMECIPTGIWWEFFSCRWMVQRRTESTILGHWCLLEWTWMRSLESMSDRSNKRYEEPVLTRERGSTTVRGTSQRHCCIQLGISGLIAEWFGWVWCGSQFEQSSKALKMVLDPFYFSVPQTERFLFCQKLHSWCGLVPRRKLRKKTCSCRDLPPEFSIGCLKYFLKICWLSIVVNCISQEHTPWKLIHTLVLAYDKRNTNQITGHCYPLNSDLWCLSDVFPPIWVPLDIQGPKA